MNNKLTDERVSNATLIRLIQWADQHNSHYVAAALCELQERRKADNQEPAGYHVIKECGKVGCSVATLEEAEKTRDFWNKKWTIRPYFYSAAPAPVVLEEMPAGLAGQIVSLLPCPFCGSPAEHYPDGDMEGHIIMCGNKNGDCNLQAFGFTTPEEAEKAWNTRAALLQGAEPVSQTYELPELIEGMEVSIDVSTCDADAGHRYFGTVTEVSELDGAKNGYILLVQDAEPNFKTAGNSPVIPDGYALVPVEPTDEMIAAAMECDDVVFDSKDPTAFCVQFLEIYCAMVTAAPKPEINNE